MSTEKTLKEIINHRLNKLNEIKKNNVDPFPHKYKTNIDIGSILINDTKYLEKKVSIAGRIVSIRNMG